MNLINTLLNLTDQQVNHYTFDAYHTLASSLSLTLTLLMVLYFVGLGWLVVRGLIPITPLALAWHILKASIILILATRWSYFGLIITHFLIHWPDRLLGVLLNNTAGGATNTTSITSGLAHIWQTGCNVFLTLWRNSPPDFLLGTLMGFIGIGAVVALTAVPLFYIIMAKIILSILLVIAPLILPLLLWRNTHAIFAGWLRLLVQWALIPVFIYTFAGLYLNITQLQINRMSAPDKLPNTADILGFLLLAIIIVAMYWQAAKIPIEIARRLNFGHNFTSHKNNIPSMVIRTWRETT